MFAISPTLFSEPKPVKKLRDYQEEAVCSIFEYFSKKGGNPLVVIPTGGGKSLVLSEFVRRATELYPGTRITIVSHVAELIKQNALELSSHAPNLKLTFCSDKLGSKNQSGDVVLATIQSIYKRALKYPVPPDLLLIDEAHLLPHDSDTSYRKFIEDLKMVNPDIKIIGFTATPFRAGRGMLHKGEGALFTDVCYEISILDLIDRGYLTPIITPTIQTRMDVHDVKMRGGDFVANDLERAVDKDMLTRACVNEIVSMGQRRKRWLVFTAGIKHCEHVRDEIRKYGISCEMIHGKTPDAERNDIVSRYKNGDLRCLVNVMVFTTGFDNPSIDLMAFMRPTRSPVLYIQCAGRGMRLFKDKPDCMLLDFGQVVESLGPIDMIHIKEKQKSEGEAPQKNCPECKQPCHAAIMQCPACGYQFPEHEIKVDKRASSAAVLSTQLQAERKNVTAAAYFLHKKEGRPDSLRIEYMCGPVDSYRTWIQIEASGTRRIEACDWWRAHTNDSTPPNTVGEALFRKGEIQVPRSIDVKKVSSKNYDIVKEYF